MVALDHDEPLAAHAGLDAVNIVPQRDGDDEPDLPVQAQEGRWRRALVRENQIVVLRTVPELAHRQAERIFQEIADQGLAQRHATQRAHLRNIQRIQIHQHHAADQPHRPHVHHQGAQELGRSARRGGGRHHIQFL